MGSVPTFRKNCEMFPSAHCFGRPLKPTLKRHLLLHSFFEVVFGCHLSTDTAL